MRDKDGAARAYSRSVAVNNATPVVALSFSATALVAGGTLSAPGSFIDAGVNDAPWRPDVAIDERAG